MDIKNDNESLSDYVKRRNGLPLGASGSLTNMLSRSFGAGSFSGFWQYWNPIWGYYLSRYIFLPLKRHLPPAIALLLTFVVSGAIHDIAISLVKWQFTFLFTPWFFLMAGMLIIGQKFKIKYSNYHQFIRSTINLSFLMVSFVVVKAIF